MDAALERMGIVFDTRVEWDVLFRMRELVLMDGYRFRYPSECGGVSASSVDFVLCVWV